MLFCYSSFKSHNWVSSFSSRKIFTHPIAQFHFIFIYFLIRINSVICISFSSVKLYVKNSLSLFYFHSWSTAKNNRILLVFWPTPQKTTFKMQCHIYFLRKQLSESKRIEPSRVAKIFFNTLVGYHVNMFKRKFYVFIISNDLESFFTTDTSRNFKGNKDWGRFIVPVYRFIESNYPVKF